MTERFSDRQGYRPTAAQITVREDAPSELRGAIPLIAEGAGMSPSDMRRVICGVLLVPPDPYNWSEYPNIRHEVDRLMDRAPWHKIYDIAEALYAALIPDHDTIEFERRLNDFFSWKTASAGSSATAGSPTEARKLSPGAPTKFLTAWTSRASNAQRTKCVKP